MSITRTMFRCPWRPVGAFAGARDDSWGSATRDGRAICLGGVIVSVGGEETRASFAMISGERSDHISRLPHVLGSIVDDTDEAYSARYGRIKLMVDYVIQFVLA